MPSRLDDEAEFSFFTGEGELSLGQLARLLSAGEWDLPIRSARDSLETLL